MFLFWISSKLPISSKSSQILSILRTPAPIYSQSPPRDADNCASRSWFISPVVPGIDLWEWTVAHPHGTLRWGQHYIYNKAGFISAFHQCVSPARFDFWCLFPPTLANMIVQRLRLLTGNKSPPYLGSERGNGPCQWSWNVCIMVHFGSRMPLCSSCAAPSSPRLTSRPNGAAAASSRQQVRTISILRVWPLRMEGVFSSAERKRDNLQWCRRSLSYH